MKNLFSLLTGEKYILGMFLLVVLASSCKKKDPAPPPVGNINIKIVNAVEGSNSQDFYSNDTKLSTTALAYGQSSSYLTGNSSNNTYKVTDAGSTTANASYAASIPVGQSVTAFYYVLDANGQKGLGLLSDDLTAPATGKAKVSFLNLGINLLTGVNVNYTNGNALVNNLVFKGVSDYLSIDPNTDLNVSLVGSTSNVVPIAGSQFQANKIYTIWFDGSSSTAVKYHIIVNN